VRQVLWELHLLGERPSPSDVLAAASPTGPPHSLWAVGVKSLWAERLRNPDRAVRGSGGWAYPFVIPEQVVNQHALASVGEHLAGQLDLAANEYAAALRGEMEDDELWRLDRRVALQSTALRVWGQTVLSRRHASDVLGGLSIPRSQPLIRPRPSG
jgi:hypothetical protein